MTTERINGVTAFTEQGTLTHPSTMGHWIFRLRCSTLLRQLRQLQRRAEQDGDHARLDRASHLRTSFLVELTSFTQEAGRRPRSLSAVISGVLGFFGIWRSTEAIQLATANKAAIRHTVHQVDAVVDAVDEQQQRGEELAQAMRDLMHRQTETALDLQLLRARRRVDAVSAVLAGLLHGRLHHRIVSLVDVQKEWLLFKDKMEAGGWAPGPKQLHQLFGCPVSAWMEDDFTVAAALHLPLSRPSTPPLRLFRPTWLPLLLGSSLWEFGQHSNHQWLAVSASGHTTVVSDWTLGRCVALGEDHFCTGVLATSRAPQTNCLSALWSRNWTQAARACRLRKSTPRTGAWSINASSVALLLPEPTNVVATCHDGRHSATELSGYFALTLSAGCAVTTKDLWITAGSDKWTEETQLTTAMNLSDVETVVGSAVAETKVFNWSEQTGPRLGGYFSKYGTLSEQVEDIYREYDTGPTKWTIAAMIVAGLAVLVLAAFFLFFYCRFRKAAAHPT